MIHIRYAKILGEAIICGFADDGSLSCATFFVEGKERDVVGDLPGISLANADGYLQCIGYAQDFRDDHICIATELSRILEGSPFWVESVSSCSEGYRIGIISKADRFFVFPERLFYLIIDDNLSPLRFSSVRSHEYACRFLESFYTKRSKV